jgi:hypothetical protein
MSNARQILPAWAAHLTALPADRTYHCARQLMRLRLLQLLTLLPAATAAALQAAADTAAAAWAP